MKRLRIAAFSLAAVLLFTGMILYALDWRVRWGIYGGKIASVQIEKSLPRKDGFNYRAHCIRWGELAQEGNSYEERCCGWHFPKYSHSDINLVVEEVPFWTDGTNSVWDLRPKAKEQKPTTVL